nr:GDSL-type esterase/lipase family protein [Nanchangia anserum]
MVAGTADPRRLGWVGRVMSRTPFAPDQHVLSLAVPYDTTQGLVQRFATEVVPRLGRRCDNRLVISLGVGDIRGVRLSAPRTRLNLANLLDQAASHQVGCFVVGPPPLPGVEDDQLAHFSRACAEVCARRKVPYVDTYTALKDHDQWLSDLAAGDGLPGQAGYGLLAWLVLHRDWVSWLLGEEGEHAGVPTH